MKGLPLKAVIICLLLSSVLTGYVLVEYLLIKNAGISYQSGSYDKALKGYSRGNQLCVNHDLLNFNRGVVFYKQGDYQRALTVFSSLSDSKDRSIKFRANYNAGNTFYRLAEAEERNFEKGGGLYRKALGHYEAALNINRSDEDARFNHGLLLNKVKELDNGPSRNDRPGRHEKGNNNNSEEQSGRQGNDEAAAKGSQLFKQKEPVNAGKERAEKAGNENHSMPRETKMTGQDAELLLDEYRKIEMSERPPVGSMKRGKHSIVEKDW